MKTINISKPLEKEVIENLVFPKDDVLSDPKERKDRTNRLEMALMYGNTAYYKVKLFFEDENGPKMVHTTIWDVTPQDVILKGKTRIPIHRIKEIRFP